MTVSVIARLRHDWPWIAAALLCTALMSTAGLVGFAWNDYDAEVSAAMRALIDGHLVAYLQQLPAYGGSLVLRAPFASATAALGGGELAVYRAVSIPCLLAVAWLAVVLVGRMRARERTVGARALVLGLCVFNPVTLRALELGHPEELLAAALAIGAVLAASDRRTLLAAVLLGLAMATKAWAVLAIGPVLLALPARRVRALVIAGTVTAVVLAPILLAGAHHALITGVGTTGGVIFQPWQLFWWLGDTGHVVIGANGMPKPDGYRVPPEWLSPLTHPLIAFLVVPLSALWARVRGWAPRIEGEQVLALLALLLLARGVLDPWNTIYYELPFLLALVAWEALCVPGRLPIVALAATTLTWATFEWMADVLSPDLQCVFFLAWSLPLWAWLARETFAPGARVRGRVASRTAYA
jgi:hypothetical protein